MSHSGGNRRKAKAGEERLPRRWRRSLAGADRSLPRALCHIFTGTGGIIAENSEQSKSEGTLRYVMAVTAVAVAQRERRGRTTRPQALYTPEENASPESLTRGLLLVVPCYSPAARAVISPAFVHSYPTFTASIETEPPSTPSTGNLSGSDDVRVPAT